jgi:GNAT superfamily N-acetyltransferase
MERELIVTRRGTAGDQQQTAELWCSLVLHHTALNPELPGLAPDGVQQWAKRLAILLEDPTCRLFVAQSPDGRLVGFVTGFVQYWPSVYEPAKFGKVADLFVEPQWRNRGIAHRLLAQLTGWFLEEHVDRIEVNMMTANQRAIEFWRRLGGEELMLRMWLPPGWQNSAQKGA